MQAVYVMVFMDNKFSYVLNRDAKLNSLVRRNNSYFTLLKRNLSQQVCGTICVGNFSVSARLGFENYLFSKSTKA
jgi:hypothetical protein